MFCKAIQDYGLKSLISGNIVFDNATLDLYAKHGSLVKAQRLFANMYTKWNFHGRWVMFVV